MMTRKTQVMMDDSNGSVMMVVTMIMVPRMIPTSRVTVFKSLGKDKPVPIL